MDKKVRESDLIELYDMLQKQLVEDRETVVALYNDLKAKIVSKEDYAVQGQNISKIAELLLKSTNQLAEIVKFSKAKNKDENLSEEEIVGVYSKIEQ